MGLPTGELYGHPIGEETPRSLARLLAALNRELPGISLSNRLSVLGRVSHQCIIDLLGTGGEYIPVAAYMIHSFIHSHLEAISGDTYSNISEVLSLNAWIFLPAFLPQTA